MRGSRASCVASGSTSSTRTSSSPVVALQAAVVARTPVRVMTRHYSDYHTRIDKKWHVRLDQLCMRLCDEVIAVSNHTARHLIEVEGAPAEKVHTVVNGFDTSRIEIPDPAQRERVRREFDAADATYRGRRPAHPGEGATSTCSGRCPQYVSASTVQSLLLVAGAGPFEASSAASGRARARAEVRFLGFRDDASAPTATADLVVLPSVAEAFGIALAEALYIGPGGCDDCRGDPGDRQRRRRWGARPSREQRGAGRGDRGPAQQPRAPGEDGRRRARQGEAPLQLRVDGEEIRGDLRGGAEEKGRTREGHRIEIAVMPEVSVVIPTYNAARYVGQAIDSVLSQTFEDLEVSVVDDGSTDDTAAVSARSAHRVRYLHQPNSGVSVARNYGIVESTGRYVAFLDADDAWLPEKLAK